MLQENFIGELASDPEKHMRVNRGCLDLRSVNTSCFMMLRHLGLPRRIIPLMWLNAQGLNSDNARWFLNVCIHVA